MRGRSESEQMHTKITENVLNLCKLFSALINTYEPFSLCPTTRKNDPKKCIIYTYILFRANIQFHINLQKCTSFKRAQFHMYIVYGIEIVKCKLCKLIVRITKV